MRFSPFWLLATLLACQSANLRRTPPTANQPAASVPGQPAARANDQPAASLAATTADSTPVWAAKRGDYQPSRVRACDLVHTRLDVRFDWAKQHLLGVATLTLRPHFYPQDTLTLDAKGFTVNKVELVDAKTRQATPLRYAYDGRVLVLHLGRRYVRTEPFTVRVDYVARPNDLPKGGSDAITEDKGLYFINPDGSDPNKPRQVWTQGETESSSCWFPTIDAPNQKTTQEIYLTVESKFTTLSNGALEYSKQNADGTRTDYWRMDQPHAPYLAMLAVGEYAVVRDKWRTTEVSYYVEPKFEKYARNIFGRTPAMIEFFSQKLGTPYPWNKYAQVVVRDYVSGAMENTTATVHGESIQVDDRSLLDANWDYIIAHELFHQWFGDYVTLESWANLPLNESFANYAEYLWNEHQYGLEQADYKAKDELAQYLAEAETKQEPLIRYYHADKEDMFDSHSYAKGGRILHLLRQYVGDDAFFAALKLYLSRHKLATVEIHDLRIAFEDTTGQDLNWFFNQWFLAAGHPQLKVEKTYANGQVALTVTQTQDSTFTPVYRLPLTIDVWQGAQKTRHEVLLTTARQTFVLPAPAAPDWVDFDALKSLVGTIDYPQTSQELRFQFRHATYYLARHNALAAFKPTKENPAALSDPAALQLTLDALNDKFWAIRQQAVANLAQYDGARASEVKAKLKTMATQDEKSLVRAEAVTALASVSNNEDFTDVYRRGLDDRSYAVLAASLVAYLATQPADAPARIARAETVDNDEVTLALAHYAADHNDASRYDWYVRKLTNAKGGLQFQLTQGFGVYLLKLDPQRQQQGVQLLAKLAEDQSLYTRFAAYQSLTMLQDAVDTAAIRQRVRDRETDPRLIEAFKRMQ